MSKTLEIVSSSMAKKIAVKHPEAKVGRYDLGKYKVDQTFIGKVVENAPDFVLAIWPERRKDKDGPYIIFKSLSTP
jgi:hypothetical protein